MSHEVKGFWKELYTPEVLTLEVDSQFYMDYKDFWEIVARDLARKPRTARIAHAIASGATLESFHGLQAAEPDDDASQEQYDDYLADVEGFVMHNLHLDRDDELEEAAVLGAKSLAMKEWDGYQA